MFFGSAHVEAVQSAFPEWMAFLSDLGSVWFLVGLVAGGIVLALPRSVADDIPSSTAASGAPETIR